MPFYSMIDSICPHRSPSTATTILEQFLIDFDCLSIHKILENIVCCFNLFSRSATLQLTSGTLIQVLPASKARICVNQESTCAHQFHIYIPFRLVVT